MRKKEIITLVLSIFLWSSCLGSANQYAYKSQRQNEQIYKRQDQLEFLEEKTHVEQFKLIEVGIELTGIIYDETLQTLDIQNKMEQMKNVLAIDTIDFKGYKIEEGNLFKNNTYQKSIQEVTIEKKAKEYQYLFSLKNQKDIHQNTYYHLKIVGKSDIKILDQLRNKGYEQFEAWDVTPKETIYFKSTIPGILTQVETTEIKEKLFENLQAKETNFYQDDLNKTTYAYYGYTPYIKEYIVEADGQQSNMQISFKYDEMQDQTEFIIAFPFYNEPF